VGTRAAQTRTREDRLAGRGPRGYTPGTPHPIDLLEEDWHLRDYQQKAVDNFFEGGSGVVVLPCGAAKTLVGAGAMATAKTNTLILVTNTVSARLPNPHRKPERRICPPPLLDAMDWGLVIYDEVHPLPAPVFKLTAELQARRRLGLTAARVREDSREGDVFSLIGPKRFDAPWKKIEAQSFISPAACFEVRIDLPQEERLTYAAASDDERYRLGRLLRPKESGLSANFYTLVARDTVDQDFAQNRQCFLAEQGYSHTILDAHALAA
jgi:DNA excision repair protein ERCC-3